jgi:hypothetical protein
LRLGKGWAGVLVASASLEPPESSLPSLAFYGGIKRTAEGLTMDENQAETLANILGGETWNSGGGIWLVVKHTTDGRGVTFSDEVVVEYVDEAAFEEDKGKTSILIS